MAINFVQLPHVLETSVPVEEKTTKTERKAVVPVVGATVTLALRAGAKGVASIYPSRTGGTAVTGVVTNAKGAIAPESGVAYYVQEGSYTITFSGGTPAVGAMSVDFDAVGGSGVDYLGLESVKAEHIEAGAVSLEKLSTSLKNEINTIKTELASARSEFATLSGELIKPGTLMITMSATVPAGWQKSEGQEGSITTFKNLYEALGGSGNTALTAGARSGFFFFPDYRERVPIGVGGALVAGSKGGVASVELKVGQLPAHSHTTAQAPYTTGPGGVITGTGIPPHNGTPSGGNWGPIGTFLVGNNEAHTNMQPYTVCHVLIKT